jgi:hypothetical protein
MATCPQYPDRCQQIRGAFARLALAVLTGGAQDFVLVVKLTVIRVHVLVGIRKIRSRRAWTIRVTKR